MQLQGALEDIMPSTKSTSIGGNHTFPSTSEIIHMNNVITIPQYQNQKTVIRVTPVITGDAYANNDVLFDTTEIPKAVQENGGKVIRLTRDPSNGEDQHPSETALDGYEGFDLVVDNSSLDAVETSEKIYHQLMNWGWVSTEINS